MEAACCNDPLGYVAAWHPVGAMPGWVYAPEVPWAWWSSAEWAELPVASLRVGVRRTHRRHVYSVRCVIPAWVAAAWVVLLGARPKTAPVVDLRRVALVAPHLEALAAVAGPDAAVRPLLDAAAAPA